MRHLAASHRLGWAAFATSGADGDRDLRALCGCVRAEARKHLGQLGEHLTALGLVEDLVTQPDEVVIRRIRDARGDPLRRGGNAHRVGASDEPRRRDLDAAGMRGDVRLRIERLGEPPRVRGREVELVGGPLGLLGRILRQLLGAQVRRLIEPGGDLARDARE